MTQFSHNCNKSYSILTTILSFLINNRLSEYGIALFQLYANPEGRLLKNHIIRFHCGMKKKLPFHQFRPGNSLKISNQFAGQEPIEGVVLSRTKWFIDVCISSHANHKTAWHGIFRLDSSIDNTSFDRIQTSLKKFVDPLTWLAEKQTIEAVNFRNFVLGTFPIFWRKLHTAQTDKSTNNSGLLDISKNSNFASDHNNSYGSSSSCESILNHQNQNQLELQDKLGNMYSTNAIDEAFKIFYARSERMKRKKSCESFVTSAVGTADLLINRSQEQAIRGALSEEHITLIQGPPGTGKVIINSSF